MNNNPDNQRPREDAMEKVESYIIEHHMNPGDKLPSERAMSSMWNLNRTTLRSAINQLILEGKVYSRNGSGTYVARKKLMKNLQNIEGFSETVRKADRFLSTQLISVDGLETTKELGRNMKLPLGHKILRIIRLRFLENTPVMYEISYLDEERFPDIRSYINETTALYLLLQEKYHLDITGGKEKLSIAYCDAEEAEYLQIEQGDPVIYQSGTAYDEKEQIFEYFHSITRSEYVCFASELKRN